jgi:hypothetical protein
LIEEARLAARVEDDDGITNLNEYEEEDEEDWYQGRD